MNVFQVSVSSEDLNIVTLSVGATKYQDICENYVSCCKADPNMQSLHDHHERHSCTD